MPNLRSPQTLVAVSLLAAVTLVACSPKEASAPAASPSPTAAAMESKESESMGMMVASDSAMGMKPPMNGEAPGSDVPAAELGKWTKTADKYDVTTTYVSPAGLHEQVEFNVGVKNGVISSIEVTPKAVNPTSKKMQTQFKEAASTALVGKKLSELTKVDRIGGASFTTGAFNKVLESLKEEAS